MVFYFITNSEVKAPINIIYIHLQPPFYLVQKLSSRHKEKIKNRYCKEHVRLASLTMKSKQVVRYITPDRRNSLK